MKRILSFLAIAFASAAIPAFAADASFFDVIETPYANTIYEGLGEGSYYTIKMKSAGKVYITNFFNNTGDSNQSELLTDAKYGLTQYGYVDSDNNVHAFDFTDQSRIKQFDYYEYNKYKALQGLEPDRYYREGYYLGEFNAEDEIQIYLARGTESVASNTPTGEYISRFGGRTDSLDAALPVGQLYFGGIDGDQVNFGIVATGTFGSPLPGALPIVLVSGLFGLGFWYIRRRKAVTA